MGQDCKACSLHLEWAESVPAHVVMGSPGHCLARLLSFGTSPTIGLCTHLLRILSLTDTEATSGEGASQGSEYFSLLVSFSPEGQGWKEETLLSLTPQGCLKWPLGYMLLWSRLCVQ